MSTTTTEPDGPIASAANPSSTDSTVRELRVLPPRALRVYEMAPDTLPEHSMLPPSDRPRSTEPQTRVLDLDLQQPGPRAPSILSVGCGPTTLLVSRQDHGCSTTERVSHCRTESEGPAVPASVGARPRRCRQGWFPPIRLPRQLCCFEKSRTMDDATRSGPRPEREAHTQQMVSSTTNPEGLAAQRPCGSSTDKLGAAVNVWRRGRVTTAAADLACSTQGIGARHRSARHPKSLLSSPDSRGCDTR
jgi:hypothetical protein